jgi:hypothetical protein
MPFELEITGANFREQIEIAIRKADFFIAVLTKNSNSNVFFELGYAWAKIKRIVLLQNEEFELPANLSGFTIIKIDLRDRTKLSSVLNDFLKKEKPFKSRGEEIVKTRPLSSRASDLIRHLRNLEVRATHEEFEKILATAFRDSGIKVFAEPQGPDHGYDFALWLDELNHLIGNPFLVEIKTRLSRAAAIIIKNRFLQQRNAEVGKALLVVFLNGPEQAITSESLGSPLVLFIPAIHLLSELERRSFVELVRSERNRLVHGV